MLEVELPGRRKTRRAQSGCSEEGDAEGRCNTRGC